MGIIFVSLEFVAMKLCGPCLYAVAISLRAGFFSELELSDLMEEINKPRALWVEGNRVDDVAFSFCLFPKHSEGCHGGVAVEDGLAKGACFPDVILDLGVIRLEEWGERQGMAVRQFLDELNDAGIDLLEPLYGLVWAACDGESVGVGLAVLFGVRVGLDGAA